MGWLKSSFEFFHNCLWKNQNELFCQTNIIPFCFLSPFFPSIPPVQEKKMVYFTTYPSESVLSSVLGRLQFKALIFHFPIFSICMSLDYPLFQKILYGSSLSNGGHPLPAYIKAKKSKVTQSCPTLCDPMGYGLPGSSVHGIFQARILEWVAISFSRGSS